MDVLFVHNNFPAQFRSVATAIAQNPGMRVAAIGSRSATELEKIPVQRYSVDVNDVAEIHPFSRRFDAECRRAEQILYACTALLKQGFAPKNIVAHCGWGETLPLREVFPRSRIITYCEFYYRSQGLDVNFDPEFAGAGLDACVSLQLKNAATLLSLVESDNGIAPTLWQKSIYPTELQDKISVLHDGIDTDLASPNPNAVLELPNGRRLNRSNEVITFVARNLEPLRGYHIFMRALPEILRKRPNAQVVVIGDDKVSYGAAAPSGTSWRRVFFDEVAPKIDRARVHFLGPVPYSTYLKALQISGAHIYLTYPFVLSWSLLEAMSTGCLVIGSDTGPLQEVIEKDRNGLLTPFFDYDGLADKVIRALANPRAYESMRTAARQTAIDRYSIHRCVPNLVEFITR